MWRRVGAILCAALLAHGGPDDLEALVRADVEALRPQVETLLGKEFEREVGVVILDRAALLERWRPDELWWRGQAPLWRKLGLLGRYESAVEAARAEARSHYDLHRREIVLARDDLRQTRRHTVAHELVHALRHDAGHYDHRVAGADANLAWRCLIEGDATVLGFAVDARVSGRDLSWYVRRATFLGPADGPVAAPYVEGVRLCRSLFETGGVAALARALKDPPASTEQVLHPEKYLADERDDPTPVALGSLAKALSGDGWSGGALTDLGELMLRLGFEATGDRERAARAAAGWDGCVLRIYRRAGRSDLLVLFSVWDTPADAVEFVETWCVHAARRDGAEEYAVQHRTLPAGEQRSVATSGVRVVGVTRGRQAVVLDGARPDEVPALLVAAWAAAAVR